MQKQLTLSEFHNRFENLGNDELILDVRSPNEYAEGHIPGSRNIPYEEVQNHADGLKKYSQVYIHCLAGGRAKKAYETLEKLGLKNISYLAEGGMKDWIKAGYQIDKSPSS